MSDLEKQNIMNAIGGMTDKEMAVAASAIPSHILISVLSDRIRDMEGMITGVVGALEQKNVESERREITLIGGI